MAINSMDITLEQIIECICSRKRNPWENNLPFQYIFLKDEIIKGRIDGRVRFEQLGIVSLEGMNILDIGCSLGSQCILSKRLGASTVYGIDNDNASLNCARMISAYNGLDIEYIHMDLNNNLGDFLSKFAGYAFDYIFCFAIMYWIKRANISLILNTLSYKKCILEVHPKVWAHKKDCQNFLNNFKIKSKVVLYKKNVSGRGIWMIERLP